MADYSWVNLQVATTDADVLAAVEQEWNFEQTTEFEHVTMLEGEARYGLIEDVETLLIERGIAYSRYSDGKYDYDGDEAHWKPGMDAPRSFAMLNGGGRVFGAFDYREALNRARTDEALGALVREHFDFAPAVPNPTILTPEQAAEARAQTDADVASLEREV